MSTVRYRERPPADAITRSYPQGGDIGWRAVAHGTVFGRNDADFGVEGSDFFRPFEGRRLELSGVSGGRPSLASNSTSRAVNVAICGINEAIRTSFCACESVERFCPTATSPEIQIRLPATRPYKTDKSISRGGRMA